MTIVSHVRPKISEKEKELILGSIKDFFFKSLENLRVAGKREIGLIGKSHFSLKIILENFGVAFVFCTPCLLIAQIQKVGPC